MVASARSRSLPLIKAAALAHGEIMGGGAGDAGPRWHDPATTRVNGGRLATHNLADFQTEAPG
jgi:hypothetical protein